jgi:hypothetical protein
MVESEYGIDPAINKKKYYLAVDGGRSDEAPAWCVRKSQYKQFTLDSAVEVTIDHERRLIEITKAPGS